MPYDSVLKNDCIQAGIRTDGNQNFRFSTSEEIATSTIRTSIRVMQNSFSVAAHWEGPQWDEDALGEWAGELRSRLKEVSIGLVFIGPRFLAQASDILEVLQLRTRAPLVVGCSGAGLIAGAGEIEDEAGIVFGLYHLPGAELKAVRFSREQLEESTGPGYWHQETGLAPEQVNGWLAFAEPFNLDCERWLRSWNEAYPGLPIVGGLASSDQPQAQVYLNGAVLKEGGVAVAVGGAVGLDSVISQGCTPIGETWTITSVERQLIHRIANRPAFEVLAETLNGLSEEERERCQGNLFVGLVVNEYLDEFHRGDFLVRNLIGADPQSGTIAVGALPRAGQTLQFQQRDARAATEDMEQLLARVQGELKQRQVFGACLCSCNGRGRRLFGEPSHDAQRVQKQVGPIGLAGFFCNGEIGPVGEKNFLHGYTASVALFAEKGS